MDCRKLTDSEMIDMMRSASLRPSLHRLAVLRYIGNSHSHPSPDEVYRELSRENQSLSRSTVYNSIHALVEAGLVRELDIDAGGKHYDLAPQPRHGHCVCRKCGRIFDMPLPEGFAPMSAEGFMIDSIELYGRGLCPECASSPAESAV